MPDRDEVLARVTCPVCGREVSARVPRDGDGTGLMPVSHRFEGQPCDGRFHLMDLSDAVTEPHNYRGALSRGHLW